MIPYVDSEPEPNLLDLTSYEDRHHALELASHGCPRAYTKMAKKHMMVRDLTTGFLLFGSFVSRLRGLHEGVLREIGNNNPHAVLPLLRAWVETVTIGLYTLRNPIYIDQLLYGPGDGRPARNSFEAMFHAVRQDASQLKLVYSQLSDYSHFGTLGVWNAQALESEKDRKVSWTDAPRWTSEQEFQIVCALTHELAVIGLHTLDRLGALLVARTPPAVGEA